MVGSPKWHCAELFHMMAMVDTYGLPHLFLTFFKDERFEFKWNDIDRDI
jgi:hypothetical protein